MPFPSVSCVGLNMLQNVLKWGVLKERHRHRPLECLPDAAFMAATPSDEVGNPLTTGGNHGRRTRSRWSVGREGHVSRSSERPKAMAM